MTEVTVVISAKDEELQCRAVRRVGPRARPGRRRGRGSGDRTRELALEHGAEVVEHEREGYAAQKNWALDHLVSTERCSSWTRTSTHPGRPGRAPHRSPRSQPRGVLATPRSYVFLGRKLEHAWWYPDYQLRLFRRSRGRYDDRRVHEHVIVDVADRHARPAARAREPQGPERVRRTPQPLLDLEAAELLDPSGIVREGAFTGHWADRRRALKDRVCSGCRRARRSGSSGSTC